VMTTKARNKLTAGSARPTRLTMYLTP
jgi:hypothetical protein